MVIRRRFWNGIFSSQRLRWRKSSFWLVGNLKTEVIETGILGDGNNPTLSASQKGPVRCDGCVNQRHRVWKHQLRFETPTQVTMMPSTNDVRRLHKETDCTLLIIGNFVSTDRLTTVDDPKYAIPKEIFAPGKHCREIKYNLQLMQRWI